MKTQKRNISKPIIILGAPRSGTTILGQLLKHHQDLFYAEEYRLTWLYGNSGRSDLLRPRHARPEVKEYIRKRFSAMVAGSGRARLLEKTPSNSLRPLFVEEVFPDALYLNITRDPTECILSMRDLWLRKADGLRSVSRSNYLRRLKDLHPSQIPLMFKEVVKRALPSRNSDQPTNLWGPRVPGLATMVKDLELLEVCCIQWRYCIDEVGFFKSVVPADRFLEIRLEDLCEESLSEVMTFCELADDPKVWDNFKRKFKPNPSGHRKHELKLEEYEILRRWIND